MDFTMQTNDAYAPYAGACICSLFENNKNAQNITVHLFGEDLSEENAEKFIDLAKEYSRKIIIYAIDYSTIIPNIGKLNDWNGSKSLYFKPFAPLFCETTSDRIVHLDADMIINSSLEDLFFTDMLNKPYAGVCAAMPQYHKKQIGLTHSDRYFNTGLLVFNVPVYKEMNCARKITDDLAENSGKYAFSEQDSVNVLFHNDFVCLDIKYNFPSSLLIYKAQEIFEMYDLKTDEFYSAGEIENAKENPAIYHLLDCIYMRPWIKGNKHPKRELFRYYLDKTPWKGYPEIKAKKGLTRFGQALLYKTLPWGLYKKIHIFVKNKSLQNGKSRY